MPMSLQAPTTKVIVAPGTVLTTTGALNGTDTNLPLASSYELLVSVTAVAGSGLLDLVLQTSPDGGTTWINLPIRTAQIAAQGQYVIKWQPGMGSGEAATGSAAAATGGALKPELLSLSQVHSFLRHNRRNECNLRYMGSDGESKPAVHRVVPFCREEPS